MIEAIGAVMSNSQLLRSVAEQTSTTQVLTANPSRIQAAAITAPYLSPHVDYNGGNSKPIFVVRDSSTGETVKQFPSEAQIRAYQKAAESRDVAVAQAHFETGGATADAVEAVMQKSADFAKSSVEFKQARQAVRQQTEIHIPGAKSVKSTVGTTSGHDTAEVPASVDTQV
jgi:ADP-ribosylglycohydrolase